ncbi:MAG: aminomethyl-transferring glycine dehydrogenase subunit GcvPB, partial [Desulfurococcaceae archaeon]
EDTGIRAEDVAKGLLDRGLHAPTMYFPVIVKEALQIEFTESETPEIVEKYVERLQEISEIAYKNPHEPSKWPLKTSVNRVDLVKANHPKHLSPTWRIYLKRLRGEIK